MARDFDTQLIESFAVRRRRLREAVLWGADQRQRAVDELTRWLAIGLVLAAVGCAGCVGWTYLRQALAQTNQGGYQVPSGYPAPSAPTTPTPGPTGDSSHD